MSVTIKDIARLANVSHTTVSRALNNSSLINKETKIRIKKIAEEVHYTPNYSARSLVLDKSYNIGLFFRTINRGTSSGFFQEAVRGVNEVIKGDYNLIVKGIDDYDGFSRVSRQNFDGVIVMSQSSKDNAFIYHVLNNSIPLVVLNRELKEDNLVNILSDDKKGCYRATEYLIKCGHKKIALIEGKEGFESTKERKDGFIEALLDYKITIDKELIEKGNYDLKSGYEAMMRLLEKNELPTAVFCSNDDMALGAMKAIGEKGLRIPEDISITGFDDNVHSAYLTPALTTVKKQVEVISREGAQYLLKIINRELIKKETIFINTDLVIRDSVKNVENKE
ncbi:Alanine racemase [Alkaliphilus metalliredigens QYMF]|uniref:Alanine racemase n=3 Tax=Bacillota TaxID=1239 RepID=A6TLQ6_ALKMQ|nr:Alanine racemase [Alkaliphilus metalliredigens QYMF]